MEVMTSSFKNLEDIEGSPLSVRLLHCSSQHSFFSFHGRPEEWRRTKLGKGPALRKVSLISGPMRWCQQPGPTLSYCTPAWARVTDDSGFSLEETRSAQRRAPGPHFQLNTILTRLSLAPKVPNLPRKAGLR